MNLKEILVAERDKTQLMAESLMHVVTNLNSTIEALDRVHLPATMELRIGDGEKPKANAKAVADAVPADTEFDNKEMIGGERFLPAERIPAEKAAPASSAPPEEEHLTNFQGEITVQEACVRFRVRANVIGVWKKWGRVTGSDGHVNVESLEAHLATTGKTVTDAPSAKDDAVLTPQLSHVDAADRLDCTVSNIYLLKNAGKLAPAEKGFVTLASVEAYEKKKAEPKPKKEVKVKLKFDEPKPIVKDLQTGPWVPDQRVGDAYESMEKTAKNLNVNLDWLRMVKKSGGIFGAPDWINVRQLEDYLKHPDFDAPLIDKDPA